MQRQQLEGKAVIPPPDASASASSLLGRARAAEELVRSLRRQLDTVVSAAAAANNGDPVHVVAGNDNIADAATAVTGTASASQLSDPMTATGAAGPPTNRPAPVAAQGATKILLILIKTIVDTFRLKQVVEQIPPKSGS